MTNNNVLDMLNFYKCPCELIQNRKAGQFTDYFLQPINGTTIKKLQARESDFSFALGCPVSVIMENYNIVLRIQNRERQYYNLFDYIHHIQEKRNNNILLGVTPTGCGVFDTLDNMPHLLVAGATGSGKSVFIHTAIICLSQSPVCFTMIDLKRVELSIYNGLPFMNGPVITDANAAVDALRDEVREMESRFELMERYGVRNYKDLPKNEALAARCIIIDELADLMMNRGTRKDVELCIVRLAQLGRAAGVHLILATQRPDTTVITGLIKANIPARLAFRTSSAVDSRVIGVKGAETLTGKGDGLYTSTSYAEPQRLQALHISDEMLQRFADAVRAKDRQNTAQMLKSIPKQNNKKGLFKRLFG